MQNYFYHGKLINQMQSPHSTFLRCPQCTCSLPIIDFHLPLLYDDSTYLSLSDSFHALSANSWLSHSSSRSLFFHFYFDLGRLFNLNMTIVSSVGAYSCRSLCEKCYFMLVFQKRCFLFTCIFITTYFISSNFLLTEEVERLLLHRYHLL